MKVVVVSAHPDDETLGCGGTLLKHKSRGDKLYWLIITSPKTNLGYTEEFINQRNQEIKKIVCSYGMKDVFKLSFPVTKLDNIALSDLVQAIGEVFETIRPQIVYLPNRSDVHSDHRVTFEAVMSCTKSFRYSCINRVLMYETISETEFAPAVKENSFQPNSFCDISEYMEKKLEILDIYKSELEEHPFPRSKRNVKALATFRGATINAEYAESFVIVKDIF